MNNRIHKILNTCRKTNRKALSIFITAGYPEIDATPSIVKTLEKAGADIIELGIPFSDPLADGPTIQHSSDSAIKNGVTITTVFDIVAKIRRDSDIPIVLMGYVNPVMAYGMEKFMKTAATKGVDGLIVPDIPVEESGEYREFALHNNLAPIFLAAPTSSDERLKQIDAASEGFVYCVSLTGVTGKTNGLSDNVSGYLKRCKKCITHNPILVGFGISSGKDAHDLAPHADGIIVGSALIKRIQNQRNGDYYPEINAFVRDLREGLDNN